MKKLALASLVLALGLAVSGCAKWREFNDYLGSKAIKYEPRSEWQKKGEGRRQPYDLNQIIP